MKLSMHIQKVVFALLILTMAVPACYALDAVASIRRSVGNVEVTRNAKTLIGRAGLILNDGDVVHTHRKSKATILYRDGSEIRLFQDSRLEIVKSVETKSGARKFINKLKLKWGSFWGKFAKGKQQTHIETPTATAGIKGTTFTLVERNGSFSASLGTGLISVENDAESIDLTPGKMIEDISKGGTIKDKIKDLPYRLTVKGGAGKIHLPKPGRSKKIYFEVQLIDLKSNQNVAQQGKLYISASTDKVEFPPGVTLNSRGYARIEATVKPFAKKDLKNGQVEIFAAMDGEEYLHIGAGSAFLRYHIPKTHVKTIQIDANSGVTAP